MSSAAYRINGDTVPRERFYAVACDPGRSVVVEACAGAGKTWMLVSRIVRALLDGARPHEILAITFTRKAAGEMRQRLVEWLREWSTDQATDEVRIRALCDRGLTRGAAEGAQAALGELNEFLLRGGRMVEISTFHAWFSQLLRAAPLALLDELGLSPSMELLEDISSHDEAVFRRFHARVLADHGLSADYRTQVLLRGRFSTREWLKDALEKRIEIELAKQSGVLFESVPARLEGWPDLDEPLQAVHDPAVMEPLRRLVQWLGATGKPGLVRDAREIEAVLGRRSDQAIFDGVFKAIFTDKGTPRAKLGGFPEFGELCDALVHIEQAEQQRQQHQEHGRMVRLSLALMDEFAAYKRERGLADMPDLERCALALLRDSTMAGWMQERLDTRVRHVLIDEFQDTSPLQWHALHAWLAGYAGAGGGFSGQTPPSVFIVGDPKQSIYRFRRAEPLVFAAASDFVRDGLGGALLACDHTRRNSPQVLGAVNHVFAAAQNAAEFQGFRTHTTELPALGEESAPWPVALAALPLAERPSSGVKRPAADAAPEEAPSPRAWRDSLTTPRDEDQVDGRQQEARQVAHAVAMLLTLGVKHPRTGRPLKPDDIHVLARKRDSLRALARELRELQLPFAAPESMTLMDSTEVQDLVALLDVLASPQHHLSLARALKSPIFGASDEDLILLADRVKVLRAEGAGAPRADHETSWWAALMNPPVEGLSPALRRARTLLKSWRGMVCQVSPHDLLDHIVHKGEVFERMVAAVPAAQRSAAAGALQALMGQALLLDGARFATIYNFVRALKQRPIHLQPSAMSQAVQLLTVHGAKGLEAEVVFVMDAHPTDQRAANNTLLIDWPVESEAPIVCAFIHSEKRCPPSLQPLMARERAARQREELNGLYVAMTRARECLVVSATERRGESGSWATWWERLGPVLTPWALDLNVGQAQASGGSAPGVQVWALPEIDLGKTASDAQLQLPGLAGRETKEAQRGLIDSSAAIETEASRLGQAVHLVLQWATQSGAHAERSVMVSSAALQHAVGPDRVAEHVERILGSTTCAPFFDARRLEWAGNEVAVTVQGQVQRVDRLVAQKQPDGSLCWWVLDYKLNETPQTLPAYRAQLLAYAKAIAKLQPDDKVRCAFITGSGQLVEVH